MGHTVLDKGGLAMGKQKIKVGIPTLHCYDRLVRLCDYLLNDKHPCIEAEILILDNGGQIGSSLVADRLATYCNLLKCQIITPPYNLGVAKSWNYLIGQLGQCIIANDDVVFGLNDIATFLKVANNNPEVILFETSDPVGGFSTFYVNRPQDWLEMGGFDELFAPAYFEDNDCRWRLLTEGNPVIPVNLPSWSHDNSGTLHSGSDRYKRMHWCCFERNKAYYQMKWGGLPGHEIHTIPFDK